jgi:hypothetical protein
MEIGATSAGSARLGQWSPADEESGIEINAEPCLRPGIPAVHARESHTQLLDRIGAVSDQVIRVWFDHPA